MQPKWVYDHLSGEKKKKKNAILTILDSAHSEATADQQVLQKATNNL